MIIGDPYKFALIFDEVKEWCYGSCNSNGHFAFGNLSFRDSLWRGECSSARGTYGTVAERYGRAVCKGTGSEEKTL